MFAALWAAAKGSAQELEGERLLSSGGDFEVNVAARVGGVAVRLVRAAE